MSKTDAEQRGCGGHCMAKQDSFLHAWVSMSQCRETGLDKHLGISVLQTEALLCQQYITCIALAVVDLFLLFPLSRDGKGTLALFLKRPASDWHRGATSSIPCRCRLGPGLKQSLQGKGLADSSAAVMCTSAAMCCQKHCSYWCLGSLCHSQVQANEVKLCGNSGNTDKPRNHWIHQSVYFLKKKPTPKQPNFFFFTFSPYKWMRVHRELWRP